MKYRKRPILVEAEQWFPPGDHRHKPIDFAERFEAVEEK